jgi:hypothetical protein
MSQFTREEMIEEIKLRGLLREVIKKCLKKQNSEEDKLRFVVRTLLKETKQEQTSEEEKLRFLIRKLINEGDNKTGNDTDPVPYRSTALNYLAEVIEGIFNQIREKFRQLATPETGGEQRESFRLHTLKDIRNFIDSKKAITAGLPAPEETGSLEQPIEEAEEESEALTINMPDEPGKIVPAGERTKDPKDLEEPKKSKEDEEDIEFKQFEISGEDEVGAIAAFRTLKNSNIYQIISDTRRELGSNSAEEEKFDEYLIYNLDLLMVQEEEKLAAELGEEPAFADTITEPPKGAELVQPEVPEEEISL